MGLSRVTEPPLAGLSFLREPRESSQRMGRLVLWLSLAVLLPAPAILQPLDQAVLEEQEQMRELLTSMFIDNHREGYRLGGGHGRGGGGRGQGHGRRERGREQP